MNRGKACTTVKSLEGKGGQTLGERDRGKALASGKDRLTEGCNTMGNANGSKTRAV